MPELKHIADLEIPVTPKEVASLFCDMNDKEQAQFFNEIARIVKEEWESQFSTQLHGVANQIELNDAGRAIMSLIGDYSQPTE